jgi:hypothetical protein
MLKNFCYELLKRRAKQAKILYPVEIVLLVLKYFSYLTESMQLPKIRNKKHVSGFFYTSVRITSSIRNLRHTTQYCQVTSVSQF